MDRLTVMEQFVCVAETGSFSAAARKLGIGQPAVSKAMAQLEEYLDVGLFVRSTRALSLTDEGEQFYANAQEVIEAAERTEAEARGTSRATQGTVRLSASDAIISTLLLPNLPGLNGEHPELVCEFREAATTSAMITDGADIALCLGPLEDSAIIAARCSRLENIFVASPEYLQAAGIPDQPQSLLGHKRVARLHDPGDKAWQFRKGTSTQSVAVAAAVGMNSDSAAIEAVRRNLGIARIPALLVARDIEEGRLERVLVEHEQQPSDANILFPAGRRKSARVRAVEGWIREIFDGAAGPSA